jgi:lipopolysaccharide biosynthesis protein
MRTLAFHLPQFHPIPENDEWWGKGFTEWTNVVKARAAVPGHEQPRLPADLGFYDLRLPEARAAQAALAREYGVDGFVYYHYWFNGRRVLNRPVDDIVKLGQPDFPFCLCWANESWTRTWDGRSGVPLLEQRYSAEDDEAHIRHLLPIMADPRYVRINGRPLLLIYRTEQIPEPQRMAECWRNAAIKAGLGDLYLTRVESYSSNVDPATLGLDAAVEFAPDWRQVQALTFSRWQRLMARLGLFDKGWFDHRYARYESLAQSMLAKPDPSWRRFRCVTPGFDNSARRPKQGTVFLGSTPQAYGHWLQSTLQAEARRGRPEDEQVVFVNAWNEWAEGNHLEPCQRWGRAYLEAHRAARVAAG